MGEEGEDGGGGERFCFVYLLVLLFDFRWGVQVPSVRDMVGLSFVGFGLAVMGAGSSFGGK